MKQITNFSKELYETMDFFEKNIANKKLEREDRELWKIQQFYQNGEMNNLFKMFLNGCNYGISLTNE